MFPPIGWQRPNLCKELYEGNAAFREAMDQCNNISKPLMPMPFLNILYPASLESIYNEALNSALYSSISLFAIMYSLGKMWRAEGVNPSAIIGHSNGEFAALVHAGSISLSTAIALVVERSLRLSEVPSYGNMVGCTTSVANILAAIKECQPTTVEIACMNEAELTVISGNWTDLEAVIKLLPEGTKAMR